MIKKLHFNRSFTRILATLALAIFMLTPGWGADITPTHTGTIANFTSWTHTTCAQGNASSNDYVQMLVAGSSVITPPLNFNNYNSEVLNFKARTFGGSTPAEIIITVSISTDNGSNWTVLGTRTPTSSTLSSVTPFDLSSYNGTQVKIRLSVAGTSTSVGVGVDEIAITGTLLQIITVNGSFTDFSTTAGIPSSSQSVTLFGTNLTSNIGVSAVNGYEYSTTDAAPWTSSLSLASSFNGNVYVRLTGVSSGTYNGTISFTSTGATQVDRSVSGSVIDASSPVLSISGTPTNYGSICIGSPATSVTYTITNSGTVQADGVDVTSDNSQFVISNLSSTSITASGGTATYDVTFTPSGSGIQNATITVTSTTSGSNSPTSALSGAGITPVAQAVNTSAASNIVNTTATLNGEITALGVCPSTIEKGFVYSLTATNNDPLVDGTGVTKTSVAGLVAGTYSLGLTLLNPNTGYSYKSYIYDGTTYVYGSVAIFATLTTATNLAFGTAPPSTGNVGTNLTSFTVQATRADNSVDAEYTGTITLVKVSGTGNIAGTCSKVAIAGVATFDAVQFDAADTYTINATASGLTDSPTSGSIVISLAPLSIFANSITGSSPGNTNPYTTNQTFNSNITVSGIGRGSGVSGATGNDRYNTNGWTTSSSIDVNDYFEFVLTPILGYKINFDNLNFTFQRSSSGPSVFKVRSSLDAFSSDLGIYNNTGDNSASNVTLQLTGAEFDEISSSIIFRIYAHNAASGTATSSINDFVFSGNVLCVQPLSYNVTGGGSFCSGGTGVAIGLDNSQVGVSYQLKLNGINTGSPVLGSGAPITFGNQTGVGTYTIVATNTYGSCNYIVNMSGTATVSINPLPAAAGPITGTSSVTQGNTGISYSVGSIANATTYVWAYTGTGVTINGSGASVTLDFSASATGGNLTVYGQNACGDGTASNLSIIVSPVSAPTTTTFTGTGNWTTTANWDPGIPGPISEAIIDGTATITTAVEVTNLTIYATRKLIIESTGSLTVTGILTNSAGNSGLVIKSGGSLISTSENVAATVERAIEANDWHLISSPMTIASSQLFQGHYLQRHTESTNLYTDLTLPYETLTAGKGFALWGDLPTASFTGNLNAIDVEIGTTSVYNGADEFNNKGWNLVGNPFASSINWDAITKPTGINNAIYIHVNASTWATYGGGVGVNAGGTKYIASCQGFFVRATANVTLTIPASSRVHNNTDFFKNSDESVSDLVRLEISGNGYTDESVVRLKPEATAEFDGNWDAYKLFGSVAEAPQIYTFGPTPLAINAFRELTTVPVGVRAGTSGTFTIAATEINDLQNVKLEDTKTGIMTDLTSKSYTFNFTAGENESRFKLHFTALGVDEKETTHTNIYSYQQTVYVNFNENVNGNIFIYNLAGQLVTTKESASGNVQIGLNATGVYMVKVITEKETLTQKVVIR